MNARTVIDQVSEAGGYADIYGDLWAEFDVTLTYYDVPAKKFVKDPKNFEPKTRTVVVRLFVSRHVEWFDAERWAEDWVFNVFDHPRRPFNLDNLLISAEDKKFLSLGDNDDIVISRRFVMSPVRWVHSDGTPYDTQPLHRRFFKHKLGESGDVMVDHIKIWVDVYKDMGMRSPVHTETIEYELKAPLVGLQPHQRGRGPYRYSIRNLTPNVIMDRTRGSEWWKPSFNYDLFNDRPELFDWGVSFKLAKIEYYDKDNRLLDQREVDRAGVSYMLNKNAI